MIHRLQPACLIGNNHHRAPVEGEDFQMFERDLPGENTAGLSDKSEIGCLPLETCQTMNGMWGYKVSDQNYKSDTTLVRLLVRAAGKGANLLMNIGPQPDGQLPAVALERLKSMGKWLSEYGETVYATTAGDVMTAEWGTTTRSGNKLYVHILADDMPKMILLPLKGKVKSAVLFDTGKKISHENVSGGVVLHTADLTPAIDRIITLTVK
jgi:alpha-L-fucosidase